MRDLRGVGSFAGPTVGVMETRQAAEPRVVLVTLQDFPGYFAPVTLLHGDGGAPSRV